MDLKGQVALVVGGSGGLGSTICRFLASQQVKVAVLYHGNTTGAQALVDSVQSEGGTASAFHVDIETRESVEGVVEAVKRAFGPVDILVNCAGISRNGMSWKLRDADWATTLEVNLTGAFRFQGAVLPGMREKGKGRIINITSIVGSIGVPGTAAYAASKAGIEGLTRASAVEVANRGITINALALGYFDAGIIADVPADKLEKIVATIPVGRLGRVEEVCQTVGFLCSEGASYITGQTIHVNGGLYLG